MQNKNEILKVADIVSQEKGIEIDIVMQAMEESFEIIGKSINIVAKWSNYLKIVFSEKKEGKHDGNFTIC